MRVFRTLFFRAPAPPQASISGFQTGPEEVPLLSLVASMSFSMPPPSVFAVDGEGWESWPPALLLHLLCLISVPRSSVEDESLFSSGLFSSSLSSDPSCSVTRECLLLEYARANLDEECLSLPVLRFVTSASDCRCKTWAIDAWICATIWQPTHQGKKMNV